MRMLVFPYGQDCEPIIRHADLLEAQYGVTALVSPAGWGKAGKEVTVGVGSDVLPVRESFEEVTEEFDSLFIPPFEASVEEVENRLVDKMILLIPYISQILCTTRLTEANCKKLKEACRCSSQPCEFVDFCEDKGLEAYGLVAPMVKNPSLKFVDVPVVIVAGVWEKTDKFEISLSLRERFLRDGYRVSQVGSRDGCEMMGFHSFPRFMLQKDLDGTVKIPCFNQWIHQIIKQEQPDVILITIPGALQDFNEQFTRGFGLLPHEVFQAVAPDALVMCNIYMSEEEKVLDELSISCKYKFDVLVDAFHISNLKVDVHKSEEYNRIITDSVYRGTVSKAVARGSTNNSIPVFNGLDAKECDKMYETIIEKLTSKGAQTVL